jgi:hypothetical protein
MKKLGDSNLAERSRVRTPDSFRLKNVDPEDCAGLKSEETAAARLVEGVERIAELQARLYAEHKWSLLLVIQAMDAAGKDSLIKHVMTGGGNFVEVQGTAEQGTFSRAELGKLLKTAESGLKKILRAQSKAIGDSALLPAAK